MSFNELEPVVNPIGDAFQVALVVLILTSVTLTVMFYQEARRQNRPAIPLTVLFILLLPTFPLALLLYAVILINRSEST